MQITFTLDSAYTGATYVAGPFNISGTTCEGDTYQLATAVTKSELVTGYTIATTYETLSGGTITSTGTCGTEQPWSTGISCPNTGGAVTLEVYAKDIAGNKQNQTIIYSINGGSNLNLTTNTVLQGTCQVIGTITGLTLGDTVTIAAVSGIAIDGASGAGVCPSSPSVALDYTYTVTATSGMDYVSLVFESGVQG
jgi:hypothetical protein